MCARIGLADGVLEATISTIVETLPMLTLVSTGVSQSTYRCLRGTKYHPADLDRPSWCHPQTQ